MAAEFGIIYSVEGRAESYRHYKTRDELMEAINKEIDLALENHEGDELPRTIEIIVGDEE